MSDKETVRIRRVLLSVSDKKGMVELGAALAQFGCELIATGGTAKALASAGLSVTDISTISGNAEAFGGRMKSLSFGVESAILFDRRKDKDEAERLGVRPIDMVVCNLYPFAQRVAEEARTEDLIESVDIGGPTMIRAGAKNYRYVSVLTSPDDYEQIIEEMGRSDGCISLQTRSRLMCSAFNYTADYEGIIAEALDSRHDNLSLRLAFRCGKELRYGENPHQTSAFYRQCGVSASLHDVTILAGKALSHNNIGDMYGAARAVYRLGRYGCAIVKHMSPCGLAQSESAAEALELAWQGDPISAFGSVIAFNCRVDAKAARFLTEPPVTGSNPRFVEVVAAPSFESDAVELLASKKGLRIIKLQKEMVEQSRSFSVVGNACLMQTQDTHLHHPLRVVTKSGAGTITDEPSRHLDLIEFGIRACMSVRSNAIVVVRTAADGSHQLIGVGGGQPNRVESTKLAVQHATSCLRELQDDACVRDTMRTAILVSDGFFPFPDSIDVIAENGISTIVQPGGSIRDEEVIRRADELGIIMILTGVRHFSH